jgi:hypothetical protein
MSVGKTARPSFWRVFVFSNASATASDTAAETSTRCSALS